ncbi:hypothetical protein D8I35_04275 [Corticibacter populi]|uniref:Lipoprotein SmpA/OmlA domain-containing protein n=1 Tax=Corticibacter populi TaxID=1550736 RepID=A0A3M6QZI3_9BURK|nr:hypothetical protein [Corticibacter populi]RMX08323.1 hypothetical protein D8I35_04275 [Corticibacter populi]RZS35610.1 hypothetical protein EV687_0682 [Corticibacter populi]
MKNAFTPRRGALLGASLLSLVLLTGCAGTAAPSVSGAGSFSQASLGSTREQVLAERGEPLAVYQVGDDWHWFYNRGQLHFDRQLLVFNAEGVLTRITPAWQRAAFERIDPQSWKSLELLQQFGPPLAQRRPQTSILGNRDEDAPNSQPVDEAARTWLYGFYEYGRYYRVGIAVSGTGAVAAPSIERDDQNITQ